MLENWVHVGPGRKYVGEHLIGLFTGTVLVTRETVRNEETGEQREVFVEANQTVEEAVELGQFVISPGKGRGGGSD
jgi:hypothetical protein